MIPIFHSSFSTHVRIFLACLLLACAGIFTFITPHTAFAQLSTAETEAVGTAAGFQAANVFDIIGTLINVFLGILGVVFLGLVLYAGFLWMTSGGDDKQVDRAKKMLINATIGLVITLSAYGITTFLVNWISQGTGFQSGQGNGGSVSLERLSGSLGSGALRDHYPARNATGVPRNARIMVTFREAMDPAFFIEGYDTHGTPLDFSDDTLATAIASERVSIYRTQDGIESALTDVAVSFSADLRTFIFDPAVYLGSPSEETSYTVFLASSIRDVEGGAVFTGENAGGYEWSFETATTLDTTAPSVVSVMPTSGGVYARNIMVQITFDEPVDPTVATGVRTSSGDYDIIQVRGQDGAPRTGSYDISNGYTVVTFTPDETCGTNSCGETMYCLPGNNAMTGLVTAATVSNDAPQALYYDGIVDTAGNALDGNDDGVAGDDYTWNFSTTASTELSGPTLLSITPDIAAENVPLDQTISLLFDDVLLANSVTSSAISLTNEEITSGTSHEMWYRFTTTLLDAQGAEITTQGVQAAQTVVDIAHGTFLESVNGRTYVYGVTANSSLQNQYQNCFAPAEGPSADGGVCAGPYCCNGIASSTVCDLF